MFSFLTLGYYIAFVLSYAVSISGTPLSIAGSPGKVDDISTLSQVFGISQSGGLPKVPALNRRPVNFAPSRPQRLNIGVRVSPPLPLQSCGKRSTIFTRGGFRQKRADFQAAPHRDPIFPIAGGHDAIRDSWPWMALLGERHGNGVRWFCDGVVINNEWILTAAHCVEKKIPDVVRLGEHDYTTRTDGANHKDFSVYAPKFFPHYKPSSAYHDLALLKLRQKVTFTSSISPICLPWGVLTNRELVGSTVHITGWGALEFGGPHHPILQEATVKVNRTADCDRSYKQLPQYSLLWPQGITRTTTLCAGSNGKDSCPGDSGGPAVYYIRGYYILAGVVSKGYGCANPLYPGIYVQINQPKYLNWIKTVAF